MFWRLLPLALVVLSTSLAQEEISCSQDFLFATSEDSKGAHLSLFYPEGDYDSSKSHPQQLIADQGLSPECGPDSIRCENPLLLTTALNKTAKQHIIFVPLSGGLLLAEVVQNGKVAQFGDHFLLDTVQNEQQHCSPVKAFKISESYFMICVDSIRSYVSMHLVYLNTTSLSETRLSNVPVSAFTITEDINTLSNFIDLTESGMGLILFGVENFPYAFDTFTYTGFVEYGTIGNNCTAVRRMQFIGDSNVIAYCPSVTVIYSTAVEDWEYEWNNIQKGVLYICPDRRVDLRVFTDHMYLKFSINELAGNINLLGNGFKEGICFGGYDKHTLFVYSDLDGSVYVVNITEQELTQVATAQCSTPGCVSLHLTDNRYLTVRESSTDNHLQIFDAQKNLTRILDIPHYTAQVFSLVTGVTFDQCGTANSNNVTIGITNLDVTTSAIIAVFVCFTAFIAIGVIVIASLLIWRHRHRPLSRPVQVETDQVDNESEPGTQDQARDSTPHPQPRDSTPHPQPRITAAATSNGAPTVTAVQIHNDSTLDLTSPHTLIKQEVDSYGNSKQVGNTDSSHMLGNELDQPNRESIVTLHSPPDHIQSSGASQPPVTREGLDNEGSPISQDSYSVDSFGGGFGDDIPLLKLNNNH